MSFFISMPFKYASSIAVFQMFVITQQGYELCHCWLKDIYFCTLIDFLCKALISYAFHNQSESFSIRGSIYMWVFFSRNSFDFCNWKKMSTVLNFIMNWKLIMCLWCLFVMCVLNSPSHVLQETRTKHVLS